jgi:threonine/homoserine/homoserine lactone efflux protein
LSVTTLASICQNPGLAIISSIRLGSVRAMKRDRATGYAIAIGIALGVLVGMAKDNLPLWIAVGLALGAGGGAGLSRSRARRNLR